VKVREAVPQGELLEDRPGVVGRPFASRASAGGLSPKTSTGSDGCSSPSTEDDRQARPEERYAFDIDAACQLGEGPEQPLDLVESRTARFALPSGLSK
jgi:hypothetical protein